MRKLIAKALRWLLVRVEPAREKPMMAPDAIVWFLTAADVGRADLPPGYPAVIEELPPQDGRIWQPATWRDIHLRRVNLKRKV